ncbi:MAG: hypothetical protein ABI785_00290 [Gemmatimonadales bacterium]
MATTLHGASRAFILVLSGALACGGGDLLLPDPPGAAAVVLTKAGGDNQVGVVGEQLEKPLVVKVTAGQQPAVGKEIRFVFTDAAGVVTPSQAVTNSAGEASAKWRLGSAPGPQTVVAQLVVADTVEPQVQEFTAQAGPGAPDTLSPAPGSPTSQPGRRGQEVGTHPVIQVVDRFGNAVPQVSVAWQVTSGGGEVSEAISLTDAAGKATVKWTLGNKRGIQRHR